MIAEWMLYSALCAIGLFAAAAIVERWLLAAGAQVRHVWSAALLLSLAIPVGTYVFSPRKTISIPSTPAPAVSPDAISAAAAPQAPAEPSTSAVATDQSLRKLVPANRVSIAAWMTLSGALAVYFVAGLVALVRMRRQWRPSDVCGVKVLVSECTGPAVVNPFSPQIVMPEWALAMDRHQLGLMIRHEQEHRRAGDPQLLALAQVALIAMPWNPALWWGVLRLGMAVELDCDARVLRSADPRTYGDLLLEVARPRRGPRLVAAAAFAERAGGLERRIRAIARRRDRVTRGARAGAAVVGLAVVGIAWAAPHPSVPPRIRVLPQRPVAPTRANPAASTEDSENTKPSAVIPMRSATPRIRKIERPMQAPALSAPAQGSAASSRAAFSQLDSLIYDRLFVGVALSADQQMAARLFLSNLAQIQAKQDQAMVTANVRSTVDRLRLTQERDSSLLSLLTNDADRDVLAARLTSVQMGGGRRGRSGNPTAEVPIGPMGGPRSGGRGRVAGAGASLQEIPATNAIDDVLFGILLNGISLTPEQDAAAHSILKTHRQKIVSALPEPMPFQLRLQGTADVLMRPESRAALLAILSSEADRAVVDSRIVVEVRVVNRQLPPPGH